MGSVLSKPDRLPVESLLLDVADVLATSLDLDTTVRRVAEVVRKVIDYEIFAILLLNEKTQELRFRFQIGYPPEFAERSRIKVGEGVTGQAAQLRQAVLIEDVTKDPQIGRSARSADQPASCDGRHPAGRSYCLGTMQMSARLRYFSA